MKQKNQTMKGFTLIELLMVVALIAILSTVILMQLDSGRERAEVNRYVAYATQMHRLVADSAAAGQFDAGKLANASVTISDGSPFCLGDVGYNCGTGTVLDANHPVYKALTYLTELPETNVDNAFSPYSKSNGVYMIYKPSGERVIRVVMTVGTDDAPFVTKLCERIGWQKTQSGNDCYRDVKLHSRL